MVLCYKSPNGPMDINLAGDGEAGGMECYRLNVIISHLDSYVEI